MVSRGAAGEFPANVDRKRLREHFRTTYGLSEEQINKLLDSTTKSMNAILGSLDAALDKDRNLEEISRQWHSMKGLLLNMGEQQWAEVARELENAAARGEKRDYGKMVRIIRQGVEDIL